MFCHRRENNPTWVFLRGPLDPTREHEGTLVMQARTVLHLTCAHGQAFNTRDIKNVGGSRSFPNPVGGCPREGEAASANIRGAPRFSQEYTGRT